MTAIDWMHALAEHVRETRHAHPDADLVIVFDIDGTIVDTRHLAVDTLLRYDRWHGTSHFVGVTAEEVTHHEARIDDILDALHVQGSERVPIAEWYERHMWDAAAIGAAHRPYQGVLGVIRWFQLQPHMHVAIDTGRPEALREVTLAALNALGRRHRVTFADERLFMNAGGPSDVAAGKVEGLRRLAAAGYRVVAVVDNEPAMIAAMSEAGVADGALFLHADTIFESRRQLPRRTVSGSRYGLSRLVDEEELGRRVTFVWHGVNDEHNLTQFLGSSVRWAEIDVRRDPGGRLVLRHDAFSEAPWRRDEGSLLLGDALSALRTAGRSVKVDLKEGDDTLDEVLAVVDGNGFADDELWFNGSIEALGEEGFRLIRARRPGSVVQCPIDFLVPLVLAAPSLAAAGFALLRAWGVDRLSLDWRTPVFRGALDAAESAGWNVNLYGVPDLEAFLEATLLLPASVTADFNFPEWSYDGRGPARGMQLAGRA